MQYFRSSTEAVGGNSQSDHLFRLAQIAEVLGTPEYRSGAMRFRQAMFEDSRRSGTPDCNSRGVALSTFLRSRSWHGKLLGRHVG